MSPPEAGASNGGAGRNRTDDILLAKQALFHLSYGPSSGRGELSLAEKNVSET
jgi:hypothetical protein